MKDAKARISRGLGRRSTGACVREMGEDIGPLFDAMHSRLASVLLDGTGPLAGADVLFVGGGQGREIRRLAQLSGPFTAANIDVSEKALDEYARRMPAGDRRLVALADGMGMPFKDGAFDVAVLYNSLHHMDDIAACLREAMRVADKVCVVDRRRCALSKAGRALGLIRPEEGVEYANEMDLKEVADLASEAGARISYIRTHMFLLYFVNWAVHDFIVSRPPLLRCYLPFVEIADAFFRSFGNGVVIVLDGHGARIRRNQRM